MRAYLIATCIVFGLLVVVHLGRLIVEGPRVASDPWFVGATVVAAGLAGWSWRLLRRRGRAPHT